MPDQFVGLPEQADRVFVQFEPQAKKKPGFTRAFGRCWLVLRFYMVGLHGLEPWTKGL
jgi:hypothetical protein